MHTTLLKPATDTAKIGRAFHLTNLPDSEDFGVKYISDLSPKHTNYAKPQNLSLVKSSGTLTVYKAKMEHILLWLPTMRLSLRPAALPSFTL